MAQDYRNWPHAVMIAIDQLGNALAGGHPDATISSRVGYYSVHGGRIIYYWKLLELIIDFAFYPVDGPDHCKQAWKEEGDKPFQLGSDTARLVLSMFIVVTCPLIALALRLAILVWPSLSYRHKQPSNDI